MTRRFGTRLLSSVPLLLSSGLAGCYAHHTADEGLLDISFPEDVYPDAGAAPAADAGSSKGCTQTDPIQLLICQFTQGGTGGTTTTMAPATTANSFQDILNGILGGNTGSNTSSGFQDIIDLVSVLGGQGTTTPSTTPTTQTPSIEDILQGFGLTPPATRDAGAPAQMPTLNAETCAAATDAGTRFMCAIQGFTTPTGTRRDGGTGFQFPRRDGGAAATPDSSVPGVLL
jgi:hypothetical protein